MSRKGIDIEKNSKKEAEGRTMHQRSWLAVKPTHKAARRQPRCRCWDVVGNLKEKMDETTNFQQFEKMHEE